MKKKQEKVFMKHKILILIVIVVGFFLVGTGTFYSSYATMDAISRVSFFSQALHYNEQEPGSFKVEKSAKWIGRNQARLTIEIDTVLRMEESYTDLILLMDASEMRTETNLEKVKNGVNTLLDEVLSTTGNRASLITFSNSANLLSDFTDDRETLRNKIEGIYDEGGRNYYQAFQKVNEVLEGYQHEANRTCVVVIITNGVPNIDTPNEKGYYRYLKEKYPYLAVNLVVYELKRMEIPESMKEVSDKQYYTEIEELESSLSEASMIASPYIPFKLIEEIDSTYFELKRTENVEISEGEIRLEEEKKVITWELDYMSSGKKPKMTIDLELKEAYRTIGGVYPTSKRTLVESKIENQKENIEDRQTPRLKNQYKVTYDGNIPNGCIVSNIPEPKNAYVYDKVEIGNEIQCEGYQFQGWKIVTEGVSRPSDGYFVMPEKDIILRAEWSKTTILKSMEGEIYRYIPPVLRKRPHYNEDIWTYKDSITKVIFQDRIQDIPGSIETFDISEAKNWGVVGHIVPNEEGTTYTCYIQGEERVEANPNSERLFNGFFKLETIEGLEYFDTSNVTSMQSMFEGDYYGMHSLEYLDISMFNTSKVTIMSHMFAYRKKLKGLDLSNFDTSNVTSMQTMFSSCEALESLDLSNFDTSNVTDMQYMFQYCKKLISLDVTNFDTSKVTSMQSMFNSCEALESLDVSHFDTSNVTNMQTMFLYCKKLISLDVTNFDTSKVTSMQSMFNSCEALESLDLSNFDTSNVTNMQTMFLYCRKLISLSAPNFDTSKVTSMQSMFNSCEALQSLDLSSFQTENVTSMEKMFNSCMALESLDVSRFDTTNVTDISYMFYSCGALESLDVSHFDTSNVTNMQNMFDGCNSLLSLDLSSFQTENVTSMEKMFMNCSSLTSLSISNLDTSNVTSMKQMFASCLSLSTLDLSHFNTSKVTNMSEMFLNSCSFLSLDLSSFDTSSVIDMRNMFSGCWGLTTLNIKNFDTLKVTNMSNMFNGCTSLTEIKADTAFDTSNVTNMQYMFFKCYKLNWEITVSNPNLTGYQNMFYEACVEEGSGIIVHYKENTSTLVDQLIETKSANSNVTKGNLVIV